jgi:hypothetical protein
VVNVVWLQYNLQLGCSEASVCTHDNAGHSRFWRRRNLGTALGETRNREIMLRGQKGTPREGAVLIRAQAQLAPAAMEMSLSCFVSLLSTALLPPTRAIHHGPTTSAHGPGLRFRPHRSKFQKRKRHLLSPFTSPSMISTTKQSTI